MTQENHSPWITGTQAQTRDSIDPLTWFEMVQGGLQPHHISGTIMHPPDLDRKKQLLLERAFQVKDKRNELTRVKSLQAAGEPESWMAPFSWQIDSLKTKIKGLISEIKFLKAYVKKGEMGRWALFKIQVDGQKQRTVDAKYDEVFDILGRAIYRNVDLDALFETSNGSKENLREGFSHSPDYRSVTKNGNTYSLTTNQAAVVQCLHEAFENGTPEVSQSYVFERIGSADRPRIQDTFKRDPEARKNLIVPGKKRGNFQLNI